MDKLNLKFPLDDFIIEDNIQRVIKGEALTVPLRYLKNDKRFIQKIKCYIQVKDIRRCITCNNIIKIPFARYCSNECHEKEIKRKYNNPINRNKRNKKFREYHNKMIKDSPTYAIKTRIRDRLRDALRNFSKTGKIRKSNEYLDYKSIIKHLGPCPGDRKDYHIDHIIPLANFNFNDINEIRKAFSPFNCQWLLAKDNLRKGKRINYL